MMNYIIIGITVLVSFLCFNNRELFLKLAFRPYLMNGHIDQWYRFITQAFVHADMSHLIFNMLTLYFFGQYVLSYFGSPMEYLFFYLSAAVVSSISSFVKNKNNPNYLAIGASGAVSAVMSSLVLLAPWGKVYLYFVVPIPFIVFTIGYIVYSQYMSRKSNSGVAHDVHLWGAIYGIVYMALMHPDSINTFMSEIGHPSF